MIIKILILILFLINNLYSANELTIKLHPGIKRNALIEVKDQNGIAPRGLTQLTPNKPFWTDIDPNKKYYITALQFERESAQHVPEPKDGLGPVSVGTYILCLEKNGIKCPSEMRNKSWPNIALYKEK